jgi:MoaA/NifB/PqqE/SkfB family radical SAM enzyme
MGLLSFLMRGFPNPKKKFRLFQVEPTMNCNLRCAMCPWVKLHSRDSIMAWEVFERLAGSFTEAEEVDFTGGGEPLLHPRLEDMIRSAKEAGCTVGFSTNATLLGRERASAVLDAGLDWISYSVDGATPETYEKIRVGASFRQVIRNIEVVGDLSERRQDRKLRTMLFFVMMKENIHELPAMIDMAHALGIEVMVAKNLDVILKDEDEGQRVFKNSDEGPVDPHVFGLVEEAKRKAQDLKLPFKVYELAPSAQPICEQHPLKTLFIASDGSVSPCISLAYIRDRWFGGSRHFSPILRFGNIVTEPLESIWDSPEYQRFRAIFRERLSCQVQHVIAFSAADFQEPSSQQNWPEPPEGCQMCYYLYGV